MTITAPLIHEAFDGTVITLTPHMQAGYLLQVRINGVHNAELSDRFDFETNAVRAYEALVEQHPATAPTPTIKLAPPAKGTATKVTDPGHTALAVAKINGVVHRGGKVGQASITLLKSLAKRGQLDLVIEMHGRRKVVVAGTITHAGTVRLQQLTDADRENARIAAAVAGDVKTNQPVAA